MRKEKSPAGMKGVVPWMIGAGMGGGTALLGTLCTIPKTGQCAACGSCLVSLASLVGWALLKGRGSDFPYSRSDG